MVPITDVRLRIRHWFRRYGKIVLLATLVVLIIFTINRYLILTDDIKIPETTYEPQVSIMDPGSEAPNRVQATAEKKIEEYVNYCYEGYYEKAFNMLSKDCQKYGFDDDLERFLDHVFKKMVKTKRYSIQDYSNCKGYYIYEIKYIDDILATGLTNSEYRYSTEKIIFKQNGSDYDMSVGNFVNYEEIKNVLENEYLKVDVIDKITRYSVETYKVKFTNRTDSTVVILDNLVENEVNLVLPQEYRNIENTNDLIILPPEQDLTCNLTFTKFFDDGDVSQALSFPSIRVIEDYQGALGTREEQKQEIDNAIAKFSVEIPVK